MPSSEHDPSATDPISAPRRATLGRRLLETRRRAFVGREEERAVFREALAVPAPPFALLHLHGPGGIGKSSLLAEYAQLCDELGVPCLRLDARNVEGTPEGFLGALRAALGLEAWAEPLGALPERCVLLLDTFERLGTLDHWLRETLLPDLPDLALVVTAGRRPLSAAWALDAGWAGLVRSLPLRNLRPEESAQFLAQRGVPPEEHATALAYTLGHPLALALVAERAWQGSTGLPRLADQPDAVRTLLERFLDEVPSGARRGALELCALARATDEALLSSVFGEEQAADLFDWLRHLSFVERGPEGVSPHDLARDALISDLRWRNRDWYAELHRRARAYYTRKLAHTSGPEQLRVLYDDVYLHRDNPLVRPFLDWQELGSVYVEAARPDDHPAFLTLLEQFEGVESAGHAAFWLARQPGALWVCRDAQPEPAGFLLALELQQASAADLDLDPATRGAVAAMRGRAPLRPGDAALHYRFWLSRDAYQGVCAAQSLLFVRAVQGYLAQPRLAWSFFPVADAAFWHPALAYMDLHPLPEAGYSAGERHFTAYAHDWRASPPAAWLELLGERELETNLKLTGEPAASAPVLVLSQPDFEAAVRAALRHFAQPGRLSESPLLRSRLLCDWDGGPPTPATLRAVLGAACDTLKATPRDLKLFRALHRSFLDPAPTQEIAAELLDLPFSTYRRHLAAGSARVVAQLWRWELDGPPRMV